MLKESGYYWFLPVQHKAAVTTLWWEWEVVRIYPPEEPDGTFSLFHMGDERECPVTIEDDKVIYNDQFLGTLGPFIPHHTKPLDEVF